MNPILVYDKVSLNLPTEFMFILPVDIYSCERQFPSTENPSSVRERDKKVKSKWG
jgi:hypothetical protein